MKRVEISDFITPLREPQVLGYMHEIAERTHEGWSLNHVLVRRIVERALGGVEASLSMLGVEVQEVVTCHTPAETQHPVIVDRPLAAGLSVDSIANPCDLILDMVSAFKSTEPFRFDVVEETIAQYYETRESRQIAMMGAGISHALQLSQGCNGFNLTQETGDSYLLGNI